MPHHSARLLLLLSLLILPSCTCHTPDSPPGTTTLLWISIDGVRGNYIPNPSSASTPTPYLSSLIQHAYYTHHLLPIFPSLTFPSHAAQATGAPASSHGIPSNAFFDATGQRHSMPSDPNLLTAQPLWLTAARQHVRTLVFDWPMSYQDTLPPSITRTAYYNPTYDSKLTDAQRLEKLADTYANDFTNNPDQPPLRLLMAYIHDIDSAGHRAGPDSPAVTDALKQTDDLLRTTLLRITSTFDAHAKPNDSLYLLLTTDHGMTPVTTPVNLQQLLGDALPKSAKWTTAGPLALIYLDELPPNDRARTARSIVSHLDSPPSEISNLKSSPTKNPTSPAESPSTRLASSRPSPPIQAWTRATLPQSFSYLHPTRTPDVTILLPDHHTFSSRSESSLKGMHGYPPTSNPNMQGFALLSPLRGPHTLNAPINLGPLDSLQLHPTAAKLLNIDPSPQSTRPPLPLP